MESFNLIENKNSKNNNSLSSRILYSFRRCPFAMRARWAISINNLHVNIKEIQLKNKSKEFLAISSKGTVPVLVTEKNEIYDESLDIMDWAIRKGGKFKNLNGSNKEEAEKINLLINTNDNKFKFHLDRFKYSSRYKDQTKEEHRIKARQILLGYEKNLSKTYKMDRNSFLLGENETIADWAIWPFIRQYSLADQETFEKDNELKNLRKWLHYFITHKSFKRIMKKDINYLSGK